MSLPSELSFMDLFLDKEENLLNFDRDLISEDMKFGLDHKSVNNDDWTNGVDFLDTLLEMENDQPFNSMQDFRQLDKKCTSTPAESVVESSSCSDSGVSSDQQLSPRVQDVEEDDDDVEEVVIEEEVYTGPEIKQEIIEVDDDKPQVETLDMDIDVKQEKHQPVVTLNVSHLPSKQLPTVRVKPVSITAPRRVIRVTPLQSTNPRSILIPVNGVSGVRTIKIINAGSKTQGNINARAKQMLSNSSAVITTIDDDQDDSDSSDNESVYPRLQLTDEERRLMLKEGVTLPTHYPLTKHEERELKRIRRKIRNKISAQDSRKRKKEYVDGLEDRVKQCTEENLTLLKRLKVLQTQNQSLSAQLRRLQSVVARGAAQSTQPATCLLVLVLSMALIMAPNLRSSRSATNHDLEIPNTKPTPGCSRTLLFTKPADQTLVEDGMEKNLIGNEELDKKLVADLEELLQFNKPQQDDHDYTQAYTVGRKRAKTYIVPDIDDTWPPPKIQRLDVPGTALHNKTKNPPEEQKFIVELPE